MTGKTKPIPQSAALAYRLEDGHPLVCLVTARETKRWVLPKGQMEKNLPAHRVAEQEAFEEAGLLGSIADKPFGRFLGIKKGKNGADSTTEVTVFPLLVTKILEIWPEKNQRERRWLPPGEAALMVSEPQLVALLMDFGASFD